MVGFIKSTKQGNWFKKLISNILYFVKITKYNGCLCEVEVSKGKLSKRNIEKLKRKLLSENIIKIVISKRDKFIQDYFYLDSRFLLLDGKILMRNMIPEIIDYIYLDRMKTVSQDDLYILTNNDKNIDVILDIAEKFKTINFVSLNIRKLKRLDKRLEKCGNIVYSISGNYSKALRRARIIINFDFDDEAINNFKIKNDSIIINCYNQKMFINKGFKGVIIENIDITFVSKNELKNTFFDDFDNTVLYESSICNLDYRNARKRIIDDKCEIIDIIGKHGIISANELKENIY